MPRSHATISQAPRKPSLFYILASLTLITATLYWARAVLIPVALAILLAFLLTPIVTALQRRGLGRVPIRCHVVFVPSCPGKRERRYWS